MADELRVRRGQIKGRLTRLQNYSNTLDLTNLAELDAKQLQLRLDNVERILDEFDDVQGQIEILDPSDQDAQEREQFETKYYSIVALCKTACATAERAENASNHGGSVSNMGSISRANINSGSYQSRVKLPTIKMPTFDGQYNNWLEFKDAFKALVDSDESLSDIQKFFYLRSSLEKGVVDLIHSIDVSAVNYRSAWQLLTDRFDNKSLMVHNHIRAIFEQKVINKESHKELRNLYDSTTKHLRSLKNLGENIESWDRLIIYILTSKFDSITRRDWESYKYQKELPDMSDMNKFMKDRCEVLEKLEVANNERNGHKSIKKSFSSSLVASTESKVDSPRDLQCYYCKRTHAIYKCEDFLELPIEQRIAEIKNRKLCLNCLKSSHSSWNCKSRKCFKCGKPHNSLLHMNSKKMSTAETRINSISAGGDVSNKIEIGSGTCETQNSSATQCATVSSDMSLPVASQVLLSTAIIRLKYGNEVKECRALLDSGSQSHFITEALCNELKLARTKINHLVKGVGQSLERISNQVHISIMSCYDDFEMNINCLVLPKIIDTLPNSSFDKSILSIPETFYLADPTFNESNQIDILLGSHVFWSIICPERQQLGKNMPILQNSRFGWILAGNLYLNSQSNTSLSLVATDVDNSINDQISKFWDIEEIKAQTRYFSESENYVEQHFEKTTKRDDTGRFIVSIPFKINLNQLGNSRKVALNRFQSIERKFSKNYELKKNYVEFMEEYKSCNHMTEISEIAENKCEYYMPHHAVIKSSSITTKCRVVFDASSKTDSGLSLNDVQFTGPALQKDIFSILMRFRKYKYVVTADISKMFRQILVEEKQRCYQKILWRADPNEKLKTFQLNTVSYGTASAPYLAVRCIMQLARDNKQAFPVASKIIRDDFYVDDLLTGADTVSEILKIQREVSQILAGAGFDLRKWLCNEKEILKEFHVNNELDTNVLTIGANENNKTLGIYWNPNSDVIQYSLRDFTELKTISKRLILSIICQIFDPLGLLGPIIITAKIIMQELWKLKISWDEDVPTVVMGKWINFQNELSEINNIRIPRHSLLSEYVSIELHGFSDSSERAYGAALYIRCVSSTGRYFSNLLCAKSRVAPLKIISLPKLELCGAVLLVNLTKRVNDSLEINFNRVFYWTDSTITLAWIRGEASEWKTFVANRVSEIQTLSNKDQWNFVKGESNPADLVSRGVTPKLLRKSKLWWQGPDWLCKDSSEWYMSENKFESKIPEQRSIVSMFISCEGNVILDLINKRSCVKRIQRILSYVLRFIKNCKASYIDRQRGTLTPSELEFALHTLIKLVQIQCFNREYTDLVKGKELERKSNLLCLNPFILNGVIRVGGRIQKSRTNFDKRHPMILPKSHRLTDLILRHQHERLLHCGAQALLCSVREMYWPISGRNSCKKIIKGCIICFKAKPPNMTYLMGNLPECRVNNYSPFFNVGVDYGGPFSIKDRKTRGAKLTKGYICLFVCMSTKAVHLELVSDLTTQAFLATLNRFVSRRGKPSNIFSDNGTNFLGADNELIKIYEFLRAESDNISNVLVNENIKWNFIPAGSPSFGGIWEAGIKSTKYHLKRVVGNCVLTFEEFATVLTRIEAILNSRPLCPLSEDPNDQCALTPAHFLIGRSLSALPEIQLMDVPENRLKRFQRLQSIAQHYWKRWNREYLAELQTRLKWKQQSGQLIKIGSLVLIKNENAPALQWHLGRVAALYPGSDGVTRVVDINVKNGVIRRAITKVCVLPIDLN